MVAKYTVYVHQQYYTYCTTPLPKLCFYTVICQNISKRKRKGCVRSVKIIA